MSVLPIYTYGTSVLRKKAQPVQSVTDQIVRLVMDMHETMRLSHGIGLAANQVGSLQRIIVIDLSDMEEMKDFKPMTLLNPEIVAEQGAFTVEEGCLSIPDVRDDVTRSETVRIKYRDTNFDEIEAEVGGMLARVFLHELDHLNGVLFVDHLSKEKKKLHTEELKLIQKGEMEVSYPVVTAADARTRAKKSRG